jgi:crotonobetainyl-CoA hydratase
VALVTLDRPEVLNAINARMSAEIGAALEQHRLDPDVRVIVLAGEGRAFCAGHDLGALSAGEDIWDAHHPEWGYAGVVRHLIDKPIVVAAQGYMLGAGLEIGLSADIIVASDDLKIGLPEVRRGLIAAAGGVPRLAQHLPPHIAAWLVYSGEFMDADTAARWGLVNEVVARDRLQERALEVAGRIAENAPLAVQASKRILRSLSNRSTWETPAWDEMNAELTAIRATSDAAEGAAAFVEGRDPRWTAS